MGIHYTPLTALEDPECYLLLLRCFGKEFRDLQFRNSQLLCYTHNFFQTFHLLTITRSSRFVSELERKCAVQVIKLKLHVPSQGLLREKRVMAFHIHDFCVHFLNRARQQNYISVSLHKICIYPWWEYFEIQILLKSLLLKNLCFSWAWWRTPVI